MFSSKVKQWKLRFEWISSKIIIGLLSFYCIYTWYISIISYSQSMESGLSFWEWVSCKTYLVCVRPGESIGNQASRSAMLWRQHPGHLGRSATILPVVVSTWAEGDWGEVTNKSTTVSLCFTQSYSFLYPCMRCLCCCSHHYVVTSGVRRTV